MLGILRDCRATNQKTDLIKIADLATVVRSAKFSAGEAKCFESDSCDASGYRIDGDAPANVSHAYEQLYSFPHDR